MNKKQTTVGLWLVAAFLIMFCFPPLVMQYSASVFEFGYQFVGHIEDFATIDIWTLTRQVLGITMVGAFLIFFVFKEP